MTLPLAGLPYIALEAGGITLVLAWARAGAGRGAPALRRRGKSKTETDRAPRENRQALGRRPECTPAAAHLCVPGSAAPAGAWGRDWAGCCFLVGRPSPCLGSAPELG